VSEGTRSLSKHTTQPAGWDYEARLSNTFLIAEDKIFGSEQISRNCWAV